MDLEQLQIQLSQHPKVLGVLAPFWRVRPRFQLHWQYCVDSTNRELWCLIESEAPAGSVFMASTQSSGRGQWGRRWESPPGGLYLSLGLKPNMPAHHGPYFTLASSCGLVTSLRNLGILAQVKWPNDIVVHGKKLGGLLTETRMERGIIKDVVIGLGLNGFNPVPCTGTSIAHCIRPDLSLSPLNTLEGLAAIALYGLLQGYLYWKNYGNQALLNAYRSCMANIGQMITVNDNPARIIGVAASGNLQVQSVSGQRQFAKTLEIEPGKVTLGYNA